MNVFESSGLEAATVIFGGSGFIGTHLARSLSEAGVKRIINVDIVDPREDIPGVQFIRGDVRDLSQLKIEGPVDRIYNLAAVHTTPGHPTHEYYETNIAGATQITEFAARHNVPLLVFTSSISVYGPSEDTKSEASLPAPESAYGWSKWLAEGIHRSWLQRHDSRRLVIVRPAVIFGPGEGGNFTRLARLMKKGLFIYPGRKDTIKACYYVADLIDSVFLAEARNERYILFNGAYADRYTLEEIVEAFRATSFGDARTVLLPRAVMLTIARALQPFSKAGIGIHPDRITKLLRSTDVVPGWLEAQGQAKTGRISEVLQDWKTVTHGEFS
ncbi:MAG: NAD-dependent epimerase/dehydratase family protein [Mangrovicoccus sp.]|nr:NAD-dependent epimerase/dehydratase family protein [Mangrovicoccus sp.]